MQRKQTLEDRFYAKVGEQLPNGCMEWTANLWSNGYGSFSLTHTRRVLAHRIAYSLAHGVTLDKSQVVMHSCDNTKCVNPEHLRLGTQLDNIADCKAKGRSKRSKLIDHFPSMFKMRDEGKTHQQIADVYGVSRPLVTYLFTGRLLTNRSVNYGN